jgi:Kef-type K+ transport system membrane component KefB
MQQLTAHDITVLFLSLGILLGTARLMGELAQRLRQPAVLGELLALQAGIIGQRLFVALVIMTMATSMLGGPAGPTSRPAAVSSLR